MKSCTFCVEKIFLQLVNWSFQILYEQEIEIDACPKFVVAKFGFVIISTMTERQGYLTKEGASLSKQQNEKLTKKAIIF